MIATSSFFNATLWLLAAAIVVAVLLIFFFIFFFWKKRQQSFLKDADDASSMAARKQQLASDEKALREWIDRQKEELLRLTAEREEQERVRNELTDLEQRCLAKDQENETLRREVGELENQKLMNVQTLEQLKKDIGDIESNREQAEILKREIETMEQRLKESRDLLSKVPEAEIRLGVLNQEKTSLEAKLSQIKTESNSLCEELETIRENFQAAKQEYDTQTGELTRLLAEKNELSTQFSRLRLEHDDLERAVVLKKEEQDKLALKVERLEEQVDQESKIAAESMKAASEAQQAEVKAREELRDAYTKRDDAENTVRSLEARRAVLEERIAELSGSQSGDARDVSKQYADLLEGAPSCLRQDEFDNETRSDDEYIALENFKEDLRNRDLYFPSRVIDAFHTSLKCQSINPLTVLAGVSGTGKTLLPMKYAELMGLHSLVLPVQPRWDSPQDLFGFYNYLEKQYKATELSRALVRMDQYNYPVDDFGSEYGWPRERILMVLLDEMNLARTEYYFSEFLSKLELRRQVEDPENKAQREKGEVELDTGPGLETSFRIWVPENVLFVGTMNEDETTQTLSDKVLDRSNVLRFGKPDKRKAGGNGESTSANRRFLSHDQWKSWRREIDEYAPWREETFAWTQRINNGLNRVGRPFGFRVEDAIDLYIANYPRVESDDRYKLAFADQIEQKIIPKLRGLDMGDPQTTTCLSETGVVIESLGDNELSNAFNEAVRESGNMGMFTWRGVTRTLTQG